MAYSDKIYKKEKLISRTFYIDEKLYREGVDISREEFYEMLRKGADVATSQPSP